MPQDVVTTYAPTLKCILSTPNYHFQYLNASYQFRFIYNKRLGFVTNFLKLNEELGIYYLELKSMSYNKMAISKHLNF